MSFSTDGSARFTRGKSTISVGAYTYGARKLRIREWGEGAALSIGKFCSIAGGVEVMLGGNHRTDWVSTYPFGRVYRDDLGTWTSPDHPATNGDVVIGDDVWIGQHASILSGVTIGTGAVVGAHAVVTADVLPYTIVGGNPARLIRPRFDDEVVSLLFDLRWWDLPPEVVRDLAPELSTAPDPVRLRALIATHRGEALQPEKRSGSVA